MNKDQFKANVKMYRNPEWYLHNPQMKYLFDLELRVLRKDNE